MKHIFPLIAACLLWSASQAQQPGTLTGRIAATDSEAVPYATIVVKATSCGTSASETGQYRLSAPAGSLVVQVSAIGYSTEERTVELRAGELRRLNFTLRPETAQLDEVVVRGSGVGRINKSAFNAVAVGTKQLRNSTKNLSEALAMTPGLKLRESGGVGSDMQLLMDGFSGRHIKIFIDGVPQEGVGNSFSLNNIPVGFAERIEVYKGVVPVGFGSDALGGAINIVTDKHRRGWQLDASYSYGSFNTHKSSIDYSHTFENGLMFNVNLFQNYSDNSYRVSTPVEHFLEDGSTSLDATQIERVRRFNDTYHNEAVIAKIGAVDRKWADRLVFGMTYSHMYKEIQTGVIQKVVFGQKHRKGHSLMPSLEWSKRDLGVRGLDATLTLNYNHNVTRNIDTSAYRYNWLGQKKYQNGKLGEQAYQDSRSNNANWNGTLTLRYRLGKAHVLTLNHVINSFRRKNSSSAGTGVSEADAIAKVTRKNVTGLSWQFTPSQRWNISAFGKWYNQFNAGPVSSSASGTESYVRTSGSTSALGYGAAGTLFFLKGAQAKLSYERAYRLPTNEELFGDEDLELGQIGLKPEKSDNANLNLSYDRQFGRHGLYVEGGLIYRNTRDYIQRRIGTYSGNKTYASYENHGKVETKGYTVSLRYTWGSLLSVGGNLTRTDVRDRVRTIAGGTAQQNLTYGARIPNQPYLFAGSDLSLSWTDLFGRGDQLTLSYDNFYMHSFPLYSERLGSSASKEVVPEQFSHNASISYSFGRGRYNFTFECRNLTDAKLYDNFSLQKAGRAFYGKARIRFGSDTGRRSLKRHDAKAGHRRPGHRKGGF
ncbi:MAG: carboxypeptidase-like regulatory domain-containing protein [Alistipes sp.]|nr:carboxypeptidase-like regulatory domain-containing protein [Alistipes sp.]